MQENFCIPLSRKPSAVAYIRGSYRYPKISGRVQFYGVNGGVVVRTQAVGLPIKEGNCNNSIFAFHIHSGNSCSGDDKDPFANALTHYNPQNCLHPYHAGDMPPLFCVNGRAYLEFLTDRFNIDEIIGKTVIIHASSDDFTTQPSGNAGEKIACGVINRI